MGKHPALELAQIRPPYVKRRPQTHRRATGGKTFEQVAEEAWDLAQYVTHRSTQGAKIGWPLHNSLRSLM